MRGLLRVCSLVLLLSPLSCVESCVEQAPVSIDTNAQVYYDGYKVCAWNMHIEGTCAGYSAEDIVDGTWYRCKDLRTGEPDLDGSIVIVVRTGTTTDEQ